MSDDPDIVEIGHGISVGCCNDPTCKYVHIQVRDVCHNIAYHCMMTVGGAKELASYLTNAVVHREHCGKQLSN